MESKGPRFFFSWLNWIVKEWFEGKSVLEFLPETICWSAVFHHDPTKDQNLRGWKLAWVSWQQVASSWKNRVILAVLFGQIG